MGLCRRGSVITEDVENHALALAARGKSPSRAGQSAYVPKTRYAKIGTIELCVDHRHRRTREVAPLIVDALKRLEYRGYDSAGVATLNEVISTAPQPGQAQPACAAASRQAAPGFTGIGHTRWGHMARHRAQRASARILARGLGS